MTTRQSARSTSRRVQANEEVMFPVVPMLDMAFQLLAFFILTFRAPSRETRLDLYLPIAAAALPGREIASASAEAKMPAPTFETELAGEIESDLVVRAEADDLGGLKTLRLGQVEVESIELLGDRLGRYREILGTKPLRVLLVADDKLLYGEAAKIIGVCSQAHVTTVRLAEPTSTTGREGSGR